MLTFIALAWMVPVPDSVATSISKLPAMKELAGSPLTLSVKWVPAPVSMPDDWEPPQGNPASFSVSGKDSDTFQNIIGLVTVGNPYTLPDTRIICKRGFEQYPTMPNNPTFRGIDNGRVIWDWTLIGPAITDSARNRAKTKPVKYINSYVLQNANLPHPITGITIGIPSTEKDEDVTVYQVIWVNP
jgi:hypothetical protein